MHLMSAMMKSVIDTVQRRKGKGHNPHLGSSKGVGDKGIRLIFTSATSTLSYETAGSNV